MSTTIQKIPIVVSLVVNLYKSRPGLLGVWDRLRYVMSGVLVKGMLQQSTAVLSFNFEVQAPKGLQYIITQTTASIQPLKDDETK